MQACAHVSVTVTGRARARARVRVRVRIRIWVRVRAGTVEAGQAWPRASGPRALWPTRGQQQQPRGPQT